MSEKKPVQSDAERGGHARAAKLSPEERSEIGKAGAVARWKKAGVEAKATPRAVYGSPDSPLRISDLEIPCYVLDDGRRVLVQRGMMTALDMKQGTAGRGAGDRLSKFIGTKALGPYVTPELAKMITKPILFRLGGQTAYGYEATILADICDAVLAARKAGALNYQQEHIAEQCEILVRGFARVGIIALVDAATGYEKIRPQVELQEILTKFVARELRPWVRRFPFEFYEKIYRLRGWDFSGVTPNSPKPLEVGRVTDDLIYKRLAPGVRHEIKARTPRGEKGYLAYKLHRWLTEDIGAPKLEKHIGIVMALMDVSSDWPTFMANMDKVLPRFGNNYELALGEAKALTAGDQSTEGAGVTSEPGQPS